jgi:hypothetical protein
MTRRHRQNTAERASFQHLCGPRRSGTVTLPDVHRFPTAATLMLARSTASQCPGCAQIGVADAWSLAWKVLAASLVLPPVAGFLWGLPVALLLGGRQSTRAYTCPRCQHHWIEPIPGRGSPGA